MAVSVIDVQKAYLAYFGRPADPVGLAYWMNQDVATMRAGFAASTEYATLYSGMTAEQRVEQVYQNLLGRASDAAGKAYWVNEFLAGRETVSSLVASMQANALGGDVATIDNRVTYAIKFTAELDTPAEVVAYSGTAAAVAARGAVSAVTSDASTLQTAIATLAADVVSVAAGVAPSDAVVEPVATTTFTVTTNAGVFEFGGSATGAMTIAMSDGTHATFTREGVSTPEKDLTGITGINDPNDAITISQAVADYLAANSTLFDAGDALTVTTDDAGVATAAALAIGTSGGSGITIDSDGTTTITAAVALAMDAATLFKSDEVLTVTTDDAGVAAASALAIGTIGGSGITIDSDGTTTITAAAALAMDAATLFKNDEVLTVTTDDAGVAAASALAIGTIGGSGITIDSDGTTSLTSALVGAMDAATKFKSDEAITLAETADFGTLVDIGGSTTLTLGTAVGNEVVTVNTGTSGKTTVVMEGTGNHVLTVAAAVTGISLSDNTDGGASITGLGVGDQVGFTGNVVSGGSFDVAASANAGAVTVAGNWFFDDGTDVLTYWNATAASAQTITLVGVATLATDGSSDGWAVATLD